MARKVLRALLYAVIGLVVLLALIAAASQTQFFRDRLRAATQAQLDSLFTAAVYLGPFRGNLVTGFAIDSVSIVVDSEPFVAAERVDLQYNLFQVPGKKISISKLVFVRPAICLLRNRAGSWNFERMLRSVTSDTSTPAPFDWEIDLTTLEVQDGTVALEDTAALLEKSHGPADPFFVEYHQFRLRELALRMSARLQQNGDTQLKIASLSFTSDHPDIRLRHLAADVAVTKEAASVRDLALQTDHTDLSLQCSLRGIDLFKGIELEQLREKPVMLQLRSSRFDLDEFKRFLQPVGFLHGPVAIALDAAGPFGMLGVDSLRLDFGTTSLELRGSVLNLHDPAALELDIALDRGSLTPSDPLALLPEFGLPDFSAVGPVYMTAAFQGRPLDFTTRFTLETAAGSASSENLALAVGGPSQLRYSGEVLFSNLDVGALLSNPELQSRLHGRAQIRGEGLSLRTLNGSFSFQLDSSLFRGLSVPSAFLVTEGWKGKIASMLRLSMGGMRAMLSGELKDGEGKDPIFTLEGRVESMDLEELTRGSGTASDLTMSLAVNGQGLSLNRLSLNGVVRLDSSRYGSYIIDSTTAHIVLDQTDPRHKKLRVESGVADLTLSGTFELDYLVSLVDFEVRNAERAVVLWLSHFRTPEAEIHEPVPLRELRRELVKRTGAVDIDFMLTVKDLAPLPRVAGTRAFDGVGTLKGWMKGDYHDLGFHGELSAQEFYYGSAASGILLQNGTLSLTATHLVPENLLDEMGLRVDLDARAFHVNTTQFDSVRCSLAYDRRRAEFSTRGLYDGVLLYTVGGEAVVAADTVTVTFSQLTGAYRDMIWVAGRGASLQIVPNGFHARDIHFRQGEEAADLELLIGSNGELSAQLSVSQFDLSHLNHLLASDRLEATEEAFEGVGQAMLTATGTLSSPQFTAALAAEQIRFRKVPVGQLQGEFFYRDSLLDVFLYLQEPSGGTGISAAGAVPLNLALTGVTERVVNGPILLRVESTGLQMGVFDPLIPVMNDLSGMLTCDVTVGGTLRQPRYDGSITISNCSFLFVPNNITYTFSALLMTEGERIRVVEGRMANIPPDNRAGRKGELAVTGDFSFKNLVPGDFNLAMTGNLLVVKETTRRSELSVYGDLFVEIAGGSLRFTGELDRSLLKGDVLVRNSSLIFPPTQAPVLAARALSVPVIMLNDTARVDETGSLSAAARYFGGLPADASAARRENIVTRSFIDGLRYDLRVETSGSSTEIRMVFNPLSGEELVATINGQFSITEDGKRWFGDLVVDRAYYSFLKRFDAEGRIRFTGDFLNPELDITARYQGARTVRDSIAERTERVVVKFLITGSRYQPKIDYAMTIDEVDYLSYKGVKSNDLQSDALQFIVYGSFPLTAAERGDIPVDLQQQVGAAVLTGASSLLTGALSEYLRDQTGFIKSVEFSYQGGAGKSVTEAADIRLSGTAWSGYWRYGGTILDDPLSNANFSLLYSFDTILREPSLRNLMIEFERRVEPTTSGQKNDVKRFNSARLFYRFSF